MAKVSTIVKTKKRLPEAQGRGAEIVVSIVKPVGIEVQTTIVEVEVRRMGKVVRRLRKLPLPVQSTGDLDFFLLGKK